MKTGNVIEMNECYTHTYTKSSLLWGKNRLMNISASSFFYFYFEEFFYLMTSSGRNALHIDVAIRIFLKDVDVAALYHPTISKSLMLPVNYRNLFSFILVA